MLVEGGPGTGKTIVGIHRAVYLAQHVYRKEEAKRILGEAKQYLDSIMIQDLIDAGRIDGATELGIFHRIMLPIAKPGMFTMGIFAFVAAWNNFFNAFILISSRQKYTLPMLVQTLRGDVYRHEYGAIYLGSSFNNQINRRISSLFF